MKNLIIAFLMALTVIPNYAQKVYFGFGTDANVSTKALDFSHVRQSDIKNLNGNLSVNLVNVKGNLSCTLTSSTKNIQTAVGLGKVSLKSLGNNKYKILNDKYDFNFESQHPFSTRNKLTLIAGLVQGPVIFDFPVPTYNPYNFSIPFTIHFYGTVTILP